MPSWPTQYSIGPMVVLGLIAAPAAARPGVAALAESSFYPGDLGQAIAAVLIFVILFALLARYAWRPIINQLRSREEHIAQSIKQAEKREREAQELLDYQRGQMEQAGVRAEKVVSDARQEAAKIREEIVAEARKEAKRATRKAQDEIARARQEALQELRGMTADMATDLAERIIRQDLGDADHSRLLHESLDDIRERASGES